MNQPVYLDMMSMTTNKSILWQAQEVVADILNADEELSGKVTFIPENAKDIDFQLKNALGRQGIVGIVMTPKAEYRGTYQGETLVWELKDFTVQVVENPMVNRAVANSTTALDAAMRATDCLADPIQHMFGTYNPRAVEQGEDNGLLVAQAKFDSMIRARTTPPPPYFPERQGLKFADGTFVPVGDAFFALGNQTDVQKTIQNLGYSLSNMVELDVFSYLDNANAYKNYLSAVYIDSSCSAIGRDQWVQPFSGSNLEKVVFKGRTYGQIAQMQYFPWGLTDSSKIVALDDQLDTKTKVKYTEASGLPDWEGYVPFTITNTSIPNVLSAQSVDLGLVTSIGNNALARASGLARVTIPESVTSIGLAAFYNCIGLTNVTIPDSVTSIGESSFENCSGLSSMTIPEGVTSIGPFAFMRCIGLSSVTIPNSVTTIGNHAFENCTGLTSVTIGNSVESIGHAVFKGCSGLSSVTIPNSVTSIDWWAFNGCTSLKNINSNDGVYLHDEIQTIGQNAFIDSGIEKLSFNNASAMGINSNAFYGCSELTDVVVRGVTTHEAMSLENYPWGISNENIIRGDRGA